MGKVFTDPFGIKKARKQQEEAQGRAEELARQQREESKAEQQRIEAKYGLTPGELEREDRTFALEKERQTALQGRAGKTGEDLLREEGGGITSSLIDRTQQRLNKTGEDLFLQEGGLPAQQYYDRVTAPTDQGTFGNELELVRQMVNQEANRRGVFGGLPEGGIRFEQLGRAGVELAIKSAREKMAQQSALASGILSLGQNARAEAGTVGERALTAKDQARTEFDQFLRNQQGLTAGSRGRAADVAISASGIADRGIGRAYETTSDIYGQQFGQAVAREQRGLQTIGELTRIGLGSWVAPATKKTSSASPSTQSPKLLAGGSTSLRTRGNVDEGLLADEYANTRRRRY